METLAGDRSALQQAHASYRNSLRSQSRQLRTDSRLLAAARKALRRAQRHIARAGPVDPNLHDDLNQLEQTLDADKASLASLRLTSVAAIRAARLQLAAFLHASKRAKA